MDVEPERELNTELTKKLTLVQAQLKKEQKINSNLRVCMG